MIMSVLHSPASLKLDRALLSSTAHQYMPVPAKAPLCSLPSCLATTVCVYEVYLQIITRPRLSAGETVRLKISRVIKTNETVE